MPDRNQRIYKWLLSAGAGDGAVDFRPHEYLRKSRALATDEAAERVKADLVEMEEDGWVSIGHRTEAGHWVMATDKAVQARLLTFERMLAMYEMMSDAERAMLNQWEKSHLDQDGQFATSDWPGWGVVLKRLAH
jgi:hypothetical protein